MENEMRPLVEEEDSELVESMLESQEERTQHQGTRWSGRARFAVLATTVAAVYLLVGATVVFFTGSHKVTDVDAAGVSVLDEVKPCKPWCSKEKHSDKPWSQKCGWENCHGCSQCAELPEVPPLARTPYELMPCTGSVNTTVDLTEGDYDAIVDSIKDALNNLDPVCTVDACPQADVSGCILRMAGHDFMDFNAETKLGGSDGCTDMKEGDNAGLDVCLVAGTEHGFELYSFYQKFCTKVSLADFIVIAAEAAMKFTREVYLAEFPDRAKMDFKSNFRFGRTTAPVCDYSAHMLPSPEKCSDVTRVFVDNLGLKWSQTVALMGVHTLGRASTENSGYDGWWSDPENSRRFNNNYFVSILAKGWMPERAVGGNPEKNQWKVSDVGFDPKVQGKQMMLDTDMCLAYSKGLMTFNGLSAAKDSCCTWTFALNLVDGAIDTFNDGKFCGESDKTKLDIWKSLPKGTSPKNRIALWEVWEKEKGVGAFKTFADMREQCCEGQRHYGGEFEGFTDCGGVSHPTGLAPRSVEEFANDEDKWVAEFMVAWRRATGAGFENLQKLKPTVV
eukprot:CAMPEP_0170599488 /NCGR_PEP_ID=MMETSP0224-20130122/16823_1 /TAXON_ID=285029 /ORGANISM="Togula jolla, Strain CCCM 725" /LENGTH=560 /DNA_ID=CAMNT_0010924141 /DNA_START=70 /DNA_END=1752 /DNA_ORIENTATION=+